MRGKRDIRTIGKRSNRKDRAMTQYTLKMTEQEADDVVMGRKMFVFRTNQYPYEIGDRISFRVFNNSRPKMHSIEKITYEISYVSDLAPVEKGFAVIGFRRLAA